MDPKALANAEAGRFERKALENVPLGLVDRCFIEHEDDFEVRPEIRSMVRFIREDLTTVREPDAAGARSGSFQIVICRNVLIYFNREIQARIMRSLCREVGPGGYLVLGDSETLVQGGCEDLQPVGKGLRIWGRKGGLGGKGYRHG